jgi:hypothetical protein
MSQTASRPRLNAAAVLPRIGAAVVGGYALAWGFVTLTITGLVASGADYDDAWMLAMMLAFLLYLGAFLWSFTTRSAWVAWLVLLGVGGLMTGTAHVIARGIPGMA